jgi:hypothetical protein
MFPAFRGLTLRREEAPDTPFDDAHGGPGASCITEVNAHSRYTAMYKVGDVGHDLCTLLSQGGEKISL